MRMVQIYEEEWTGWKKTVEGLMMVQNIRKRIGEIVIYGVCGYMKRNGLDGLDGPECPKYKEEDWRNSDLRGVRIYEEEWTGGVVETSEWIGGVVETSEWIGQTVIYGESRYMKRNGVRGGYGPKYRVSRYMKRSGLDGVGEHG